ncbi:Protein FAM8A1 [Aphelenchoides fujianensis]|nr:Protein FAM8A1 [Aphelenchoides fujianensis]KAI6240615.1 Protein FAM8A1 [Aphelenchoides fujianensis]
MTDGDRAENSATSAENDANSQPNGTTDGTDAPLPPFTPMVSDQTPKDYGTSKAYAEAVRAWYMSSHQWLQCQHAHFLQQNPSISTPTVDVNGARPNGGNPFVVNVRHRRVLVNPNAVNDVQPEALMRQAEQNDREGFSFRRLLGLQQNVNYEQSTLLVQRWTIPPLSRRLIAELIDFAILSLLKLVLFWTMIELEVIDAEYLEQMFSASTDLQTLIDLGQDLFQIEMIAKIITGLIEASCLTWGFASYPRGTTPGKFLMGLQVISCLDVQPVPNGAPDQVTVTSRPFIDIKNSLLRSLCKNVGTNIFFPCNAFFYLFAYNRSVYDLIAKTIVVSRTP